MKPSREEILKGISGAEEFKSMYKAFLSENNGSLAKVVKDLYFEDEYTEKELIEIIFQISRKTINTIPLIKQIQESNMVAKEIKDNAWRLLYDGSAEFVHEAIIAKE